MRRSASAFGYIKDHTDRYIFVSKLIGYSYYYTELVSSQTKQI